MPVESLHKSRKLLRENLILNIFDERAYPTNNRKFTNAPQKKSIFIKFITPLAKP